MHHHHHRRKRVSWREGTRALVTVLGVMELDMLAAFLMAWGLSRMSRGSRWECLHGLSPMQVIR